MYPQLPSASFIKDMKAEKEESDLEKAMDKSIREMDILEKNRELREQLEQEDERSKEENELVYPDLDESRSVSGSENEIMKLKSRSRDFIKKMK